MKLTLLFVLITMFCALTVIPARTFAQGPSEESHPAVPIELATIEVAIPDAPSARMIDRTFLTLLGANAVFTALDGATTVGIVRHSRYDGVCDYEVSSPHIYSVHPTNSRAAAMMGLQFAASSGGSYLLKKWHAHIGRFKLWAIPMSYNAGIHAYATTHNFAVCR